MGFSVIQAGDTLQMLADDGTLTPLTLPAGITLRQDVKPRWVVFNRYTVLVNTPDQPLIVDATGIVRVMTPRPPSVASTLSAVSTGLLTGDYGGVRYTFVTTDDDGNIISESGYSAASNTVTLTAQVLKAAGLDTSSVDISLRRLYRPTAGGAVLFQWVDLDGNVLTEIQDDLPDASLSLIAAPVLGTPPYLSLIATFRGRLWGAGPEDLDHVRYSEAGIRYAWPGVNQLEIPDIGSDEIGITGFLQRREALGVGRINRLVQITGTGAQDVTAGTIDFDVVIVSKETGILSQESVDVYRDVGYFLWQDGVYEWGPDGVVCISDGAGGVGMVRSWFATDDYFDRSRFQEAFGQVDPVRDKYRLYLYDPEGALWWVEFDLKDRTWWGPHKTDLFVPSSTFVAQRSGIKTLVWGGADGKIYEEQAIRTDGASTPIAFDVIGKRHDFDDPDVEKYFGQLSMFGKGTEPKGHVAITSRVGELTQATGYQTKVQHYDLTKPRQRLGRLGVGKHAELELTHATAGEKVQLFGYDVEDVHLVGKR